MREILEYCIGGIRQGVSAGTLVVHEGPHKGSHHDAEVRWITQIDGRYQHGLRFVQG